MSASLVVMRVPAGALLPQQALLLERLQACPGLALRVRAADDAAWLQSEPELSLVIDLCPHLDWAGTRVERWTPIEDNGRSVGGRWPAVQTVTQGEGATLRLLRQGPTDAGWQQIHQVCVAACSRYACGGADAMAGVAQLLAQAWRRRLALCEPDAAPHAPPLPPLSGWRVAAHLWLGCWRQAVAESRRRWFTEHWRVGVIDQPMETLLQADRLPPVRWLTSREDGGYWADPFALPGVPNQLLCERFDETTRLGHIELMGLANGQLNTIRRLPLGQGRHVSFPNVTEIEGRLYGLAETGAWRECVLHEVSRTGEWTPVATLLSGIEVADPALFQWQGRYWLAFTNADLSVWGNLCLYHAPQLQGPWEPHAQNPVKLDLGGARLAGNLFWANGQLYRCGQDCRRGYGSALAIYRVEECSPQHFREVLVKRLAPDPHGECPDGLHTLNAWGERTLVDGKVWRLNRRTLLAKLRRVLRRRLPWAGALL